jgi:multidrug resistance efflux pump
MTPLWRKAYDAIERPLAAGSEAWIQSETFMDLATVGIRVQRRMLREAQQNTERWLHLWGFVSRADVLRLSNQVASLERQVRDLRREADQRDRPLLNGHHTRRQPSSRGARR